MDVVKAPWSAARIVVRAADDLNALAERARREPDPIDELGERVDRLGRLLEGLLSVGHSLDSNAASIDTVAAALLEVTREDHATSGQIVTGGENFRRTGESLDGHAQEIITGGRDLTAVAEELAALLRVFRAALPQFLDGLSSVEELEDSVGTVAATEPLQGVVQGVGRLARR